MKESPHPDHDMYWRFTGPQRLEKAVNTLHGYLIGIDADRLINSPEMKALREWMDEHREFQHRHPFNELYPPLDRALADGKLEVDEAEDLVWLCERLDPDAGFFSEPTSSMQKLHGILGGIAADHKIKDQELDELSDWMKQNEHLRTCWPYDELESLILHVMKDRIIDVQEHALLMSFFNEFATINGNRSLNLPLNETNVQITGLCASCPTVEFDRRKFCFTGASNRVTRNRFESIVMQLGGKFHPRVVRDIDYLVIGADGNPCWAYACYGRKVEQAIEHRKNGSRMLLVHENDFWDAFEPLKHKVVLMS